MLHIPLSVYEPNLLNHIATSEHLLIFMGLASIH
uniref:Uncharacterized protein n=1 Tax=Myoviridae sp. ctx322 TaxID=2826711 RepID=A0A8S5NAY5_9CAUD|nr:MAG TPA: hypothetical protein [Myoviridae sp. ctx322]